MKITQGQFQPLQATGVQAAKESAQSDAVSPLRTQQIAAIDPVLGDAQTQLKSLPDVDMAKVAEIKQALSEGKIGINLDELTLSMQHYFAR